MPCLPQIMVNYPPAAWISGHKRSSVGWREARSWLEPPWLGCKSGIKLFCMKAQSCSPHSYYLLGQLSSALDWFPSIHLQNVASYFLRSGPVHSDVALRNT